MSRPPSPDATAKPPRRPYWAWLLVAAALVHPLSQLFARWDWRADLLSHLLLPAFLMTVVAVAALIRRHRRLAGILAVLGVVQLWPLVRYELPNPVPPPTVRPERLRVLSANVLAVNDRHDLLFDLIRREDPDLVGLIEFTSKWQAAMRAFRNDYPYRYEHPAYYDGLALYSKRPLVDARLLRPDPQGQPAISAQLEFSGRVLTVWVVHPESPIRRLGHRRGFPELDALAANIGDQPGSRLVFGDLNSSEGSPHFADFLARTGLRDSRLGFGSQPSWPDGSPYRVTIDHAFLSDDLAVADRRLGPSIGSDHLPFILDIAPSRADVSTSRATASHSSP